jgi:S-adenosylmethionine hydrolase
LVLIPFIITYTRYLAVSYKNHYFVGADNGIFSLMFDTEPDEIVEINIMQDLKFLHFPLADIFVKAACHLAKGGKLSRDWPARYECGKENEPAARYREKPDKRRGDLYRFVPERDHQHHQRVF